LEGASFNRAQLSGANFRGAVGLTVEQILPAEGWEEAEFDDAFLRELQAAAKEKNDSPVKTVSQSDLNAGEGSAGERADLSDHSDHQSKQ
jgi:uncharacterized protein YjbI with pentapeptide repeats